MRRAVLKSAMASFNKRRARSPYARHETSEMGTATPSTMIFNDRLGDAHWHKGEPAGGNDAQPIVLFGRDLVSNVLHVPELDSIERGDMLIKLRPACPLERRVQGEVKGGQIHQCRKKVVQDLPFYRPEIAQPLLVIASYDDKEGVEEVNKAVHVDR